MTRKASPAAVVILWIAVLLLVLWGLSVLLASVADRWPRLMPDWAWGAEGEPVLLESDRIGCPASRRTLYRDHVDLDGDGSVDLLRFGQITGKEKGPVLATLDMIRHAAGSVGFAGSATAVIDGETREMTLLEFRGRFPHPCNLIEGRGPTGSGAPDGNFALSAEHLPDDLVALIGPAE